MRGLRSILMSCAERGIQATIFTAQSELRTKAQSILFMCVPYNWSRLRPWYSIHVLAIAYLKCTGQQEMNIWPEEQRVLCYHLDFIFKYFSVTVLSI